MTVPVGFATIYPPIVEPATRWPALALSLLTDDDLQNACQDMQALVRDHENAVRPFRLLLMTLREEQTRRLDARSPDA